MGRSEIKRIRGIGALVWALFAVSACSSTSLNAGGPTPSVPSGYVRPNDVIGGGHHRTLLVRLGDVALPNGVSLTQLNLGIDGIYVTDIYGHRVTVAQYATPHVVNVLQYQNGTTTAVASGPVPTTTYASLTILVDKASSSVQTAYGKSPLVFSNAIDKSSSGFGVTTSTSTASPSSVALTFRRSFVVAQSAQSLDVDFNAFESLLPVPYGGTQWTARTSLSVAQDGLDGMITGEVINASGKAVRNAVIVAMDASGHAAASSFTNSNGAFLLHTLAGGSYKLTVYNTYTTAAGWHITASGNTKTNASFIAPAIVKVLPGETAFVQTIAD